MELFTEAFRVLACVEITERFGNIIHSATNGKSHLCRMGHGVDLSWFPTLALVAYQV